MCRIKDIIPAQIGTANIVTAYKDARQAMPKAEFKAALVWYRTANVTVTDIAQMYNISNDVALWLTAFFSQNASWDVNVNTVHAFIKAYRAGDVYGPTMYATKRMRRIASDVMAGKLAPVAENLTGDGSAAMKLPSFYANIGRPLDSAAVTVDRHAARIALGFDVAPDGKKVSVPTGNAYRRIADMYRSAAQILGVRPCEVQAVTWTALVGDLP